MNAKNIAKLHDHVIHKFSGNCGAKGVPAFFTPEGHTVKKCITNQNGCTIKCSADRRRLFAQGGARYCDAFSHIQSMWLCYLLISNAHVFLTKIDKRGKKEMYL